ncbi:spiro-SPASM protein [Salinispira pacifica]
MKRVVCVNALELADYATMALAGGDSAVDRVCRYVESLPDVADVFVLSQPGATMPFDYRRIELESNGSRGLIDALLRGSSGADQLVYIYGDTPFLDPGITRRMLDNHGRYFAEYTFADGYPYGLTPEILTVSVLPLLKRIADSHPEERIHRESIFTVIQKDINSFDIETEISPVDLRLLRLSLTCDNRGNYLLCRRVADEGVAGEDQMVELLQKRQELLRTVPFYVNIQVIDGCPQACSYCPFPRFGGDILANRNEMPMKSFERIIDQIERTSPEATVSLSLWGEPALHSRIGEMIRRVERGGSLRLNVETSGIGWRPEVLDALSTEGLSRTEWIISLDALDPALYGALRGEGQEEALAQAERLRELFGNHVHIQAVRMNENEEHLEDFYRTWKERTDNVIIQKYDHFSGFLPERKVTDLSPLVRHACWHLKRDLVVLLDGTVTMCREDLKREHVLGNLLSEELEDVWARGEDYYLAHLRTEYPALCRECDEYYTYNY